MWDLLTDDDVWKISYADAVAAMKRTLEEQGAGTLTSPPRWQLDAGEGNLVFTAGTAASTGYTGFRAYETFPEYSEDHQALVAVWDTTDGKFLGMIVGHAVGILRTGGLGGAAVDYLAREDASNVAVLGSGTHARSQLEATVTVRDIDTAAIYSPTQSNRKAFAQRLDDRLDVAVTAVDNPETAVRKAKIVLCATDSTKPVFELEWLADGTHVTTLGPKTTDEHELPTEIVRSADRLVTDSRHQVEANDDSLFPSESLIDLGDIVVGTERGRTSDNEVTVYSSVGLAGSEVVLAGELLDQSQ
jgi:ornithine cyclodeaminase/alanine dehydrogenase